MCTCMGKMLVVGGLPSKTSLVCSSSSSMAACPAPLAACMYEPCIMCVMLTLKGRKPLGFRV